MNFTSGEAAAAAGAAREEGREAEGKVQMQIARN